jgi:F-type H+-transporting ATPase subunit a
MIRRLGLVATLALILPQAAFARGKFDPSTEFEQHEWVSIHLGALDLSITKAVVYLFIGAGLTILLGITLMRVRMPGRRQAVGELIYEVAQTQVAEQGLPTKAIGRWFPYVATIMLFIWVVNMLGFIPLPLTGERWHGVPTWGIYAATSSLSVTLALALLTFVFTHFEGIRWNGPVRYFKSWIPDVPKAILPLIVPLEILGQFMRLISLSVRLFANMLAGHMLILTFIGLMFVLENVILAVLVVPAATVFYLFEVVIVVSIQAFIFAALSAIYIGSAIEPEHEEKGKEPMLHTVIAATSGDVTKAGKAIALALGIGLGSLGAGIGIGNIFGSMIQSVARQPELRGELQGIQWLGFALTEAVVFYGLIGGLLAYVLV